MIRVIKRSNFVDSAMGFEMGFAAAKPCALGALRGSLERPLCSQSASFPPRAMQTMLRAADDVKPNVTDMTDVHQDVNAKLARARQDEPWTFQQLFSLISGFIGSILSLNAYSKLRESTKRREAIVRQSRAQRQMQPGSHKSARIVQQLGGSLLDAEAESPLFSLGPVPTCTPASNLHSPDRHFTIITTAALPWRTGTAVNPLLRALYLAKSGRPVILYIPFLEKADQSYVFAKGVSFDTPEEQEKVVRQWCQERAKMDLDKLDLQFHWYPAKYILALKSIFPTGDCTKNLLPTDPKDVLILEEPEHLCWFHSGQRWPELFTHVIGIVHTNYSDYVNVADPIGTMGPSGEWLGGSLPPEFKEVSVFAASTLVCSAYCDVNVKLSDTIMPLPNEVTCNVHGVRSEFLDIGDRTVWKEVVFSTDPDRSSTSVSAFSKPLIGATSRSQVLPKPTTWARCHE